MLNIEIHKCEYPKCSRIPPSTYMCNLRFGFNINYYTCYSCKSITARCEEFYNVNPVNHAPMSQSFDCHEST